MNVRPTIVDGAVFLENGWEANAVAEPSLTVAPWLVGANTVEIAVVALLGHADLLFGKIGTAVDRTNGKCTAGFVI